MDRSILLPAPKVVRLFHVGAAEASPNHTGDDSSCGCSVGELPSPLVSQ
jgi:hypothetical protein